MHDRYARAGVDFLPLDYSVPEEADTQNSAGTYSFYTSIFDDALKQTQPDIIFDNSEFFSPLIAEKRNIPRISIQRTGIFRSISKELQNPMHMHSIECCSDNGRIDASFILRPSRKAAQMQINQMRRGLLGDDVDYVTRYISPRTKLIPGIPSIEVLPDNIKDRESYFYTGPLLTNDNIPPELEEEITSFINQNADMKRVYFASVQNDESGIKELIILLLERNYAVVSDCDMQVPLEYMSQYLYKPLVPLSYICSQVDLVIHHCNDGIYHHPLLCDKPSITIGTQCYDREDIALRLEQLELSRHVPSSKDDKRYKEIFMCNVDLFERGELCNQEQMAKIKEEIYETMLNFDVEAMLNYTLSR